MMTYVRRGGRCLCAFLAMLLLSGCWDEVNLQDVSYISAIGIDYIDGKLIMYAQLINFASVAKLEGPASDSDKTWVGKGEGKTALTAYYDLISAGYTTLNLEHLKTVIVHKRALNRIDDVLDALNRHRAARYTSYIFGTTESIERILTTENFFDQSPLYSVLYMPKPHERQYTYIRPLQMQLAVQSFKEPVKLTLLPVINSTRLYWKYGSKTIDTQRISGLFVFKDYKFQEFFTQKATVGLRWLNPDFNRVFIEVGSSSTEGITLAVPDAKYKMTASISENGPRFMLKLSLNGSVVEMNGNMTEREIGASVQDEVRREIMSLFELGIRSGVDFMDMEHHLYRYHHRYWRDHVKGKDWKPDKNMLESVEVKFNLTDSGKFGLDSGT